MEAPKSYGLLPATWRTTKASGIIQSKSEGLRTERANVQGRGRWMSQLKKKRTNSSFLHLFILLQPLTSWMMPAHTPHRGEPSSFIHSIDSNANRFQKHPHRQCFASYLLAQPSLTHHKLTILSGFISVTIFLDAPVE